MKLLDIRDVSKIYGGVRALVAVTWALEEGAIGVVRGPNGSGKSTLLAIVGTMTRATAGRVDYGSLGRSRREIRRQLGWLGHDSLCYPDLTGRENIELAARLHGVDARDAVERAADRFELGAFVGRAFRTLSRGQRQRVALARALAHRPRLLLLDEPTAGLDTRATASLVRAVKEEQGEGATVVVVTHDDEFARALDGVGLKLERGRAVPGEG